MSWRGYTELELTEGEIVAFAHIIEIEREEIMRLAGIRDDGMFKLHVSKLEIEKDVKKLGRDIKEIEKAGGDRYRYGVLTLEQAKALLAKLVLAAE